MCWPCWPTGWVRRWCGGNASGRGSPSAGLLLLGASLTSGGPPASTARSASLLIATGVGAGAAALLVCFGARTRRPAAALGCAAGILFGVGDLATKGAVSGNGPVFIVVLGVCTALAFVLLQLAFQRGRVLETAGLSTLVNNIIPIAGGLFLFHEALPGGAAGVARLASFAAVVAGAVLLAHAPGSPVVEQVDRDGPATYDGSPTA